MKNESKMERKRVKTTLNNCIFVSTLNTVPISEASRKHRITLEKSANNFNIESLIKLLIY